MKGATMVAILMAAVTGARASTAAEHVVSTDAEFAAVQEKVRPGDVIRLRPGAYGVLEWKADGAPGRPVVVRGMTREEHEKARKPGADAAAFERRIQAMSIGGSHTVLDGLRFVGKEKKPWNCVGISGQYIRLTNSVFDGCVSSVWLTTSDVAYECEIDRCSFAGKDFGARKGQTMRLFGGKSRYPAGHVIHHNEFGPMKSWRSQNGNETIQPFSAGGTRPHRLGEDDFEEDFLIVCNLFNRSAGENEMLSAKCDSVFFLLNTVRRDKETNLRRGRNHTMEANFFVESSRAPRSCGAQNLFRNNYIQAFGGTFKLWGRSKSYSGARANWIVNNTIMCGGPYAVNGPTEDIHVVNNLFGGGYELGDSNAGWKHLGNLAAKVEPKEGEGPSSKVPGVTRLPLSSLVEEDRELPCRYKEGSEYKDGFLRRLAEGSPAAGAAVAHEFVGGLDPRGNPVPEKGANVGAFQKGAYDIFRPFNPGDLGPFSRKGEAPSVRIASPAEGTEVHGGVKVRAEASDPEGALAYVYLMLNNQPVGVDTTPPFEWTVDRMLLNHCNRVRAVAFDRDGNIAYHRVNVSNTAPSTWVRGTKLSDYPQATPSEGGGK